MQKKRSDTNTEDCNNNNTETYKKTAIIIKEVRVGEVLEEFQESLPKVMEHQNVKRIQAAEFQNNLKDDSVRVLQINYVMPYQCEMQKKTTKTFVFCTNYKGKDKFSMGLFLQMIYNDYILPNDEVTTEVIWSDGPNSEFKNQFMCFLIQELSISIHLETIHLEVFSHLP